MKYGDVEIGKIYKICNGSQKLKKHHAIVRGPSKKENHFVLTMISGELITHTMAFQPKDFKEIDA